MIGGEGQRAGRRRPPASASTEPPTVIGGELLCDLVPNGVCISASTEPPTVIGGEGRLRRWLDTWRPGCFNGAADGDRRRGRLACDFVVTLITGASTEPPTVIGGELARSEGRAPRGRASTEPPTVIGGEGCVDGGRQDAPRPASTEPPTVIGGEGEDATRGRLDVVRFNGAADGDRRRGARTFGRGRCSWCFNGAADGDRRRATYDSLVAIRMRSFNGAADGDRRRGASASSLPRSARFASTEPPTVIGGERRRSRSVTRRRRRFNGAADGDRRRAGQAVEGDVPRHASTEPPTVIGGEKQARPYGGTMQRLQRSRRR